MKTFLVYLPRWAKNTLQAMFDAVTLSVAYLLALVLAHDTFSSAL